MIWANFSLVDFYMFAWKTPYPDVEQQDMVDGMMNSWKRRISLKGNHVLERGWQKSEYGV
jgi:hypothetical protein